MNTSKYQSENYCEETEETSFFSVQEITHITSNPPVEIQGFCIRGIFRGLAQKLDNGEVLYWGFRVPELAETDWEVLGGPVIGFHYEKH